MTDVFIMSDGERIEGRIMRDDGQNIHVKMANGSEAVLPKSEITRQGDLESRDEPRER